MIWRRLVVLLVVLGILVSGIGLLFVVEIPWYLTVGWLLTLANTVPNLDLDAMAVVSAVVVTAGLFAALHLTARHLCRQAGSTWTWTSTLHGLLALVIAFTATLAAVGLMAQVQAMAHPGFKLTTASWGGDDFRIRIGIRIQTLLKEGARDGRWDIIPDLQMQALRFGWRLLLRGSGTEPWCVAVNPDERELRVLDPSLPNWQRRPRTDLDRLLAELPPWTPPVPSATGAANP